MSTRTGHPHNQCRTKRLVEWATEVEVTDHLGHPAALGAAERDGERLGGDDHSPAGEDQLKASAQAERAVPPAPRSGSHRPSTDRTA